jgi:outer membrane protein assembly factor BamB
MELDIYIYVTGNVEKGAVIVNENFPQRRIGNDHIFVTMLDTETGDVVWVKQVGSFVDDRIAHGGGITCDKSGNAVWYMATQRESCTAVETVTWTRYIATYFCQFSTKQTELNIQMK